MTKDKFKAFWFSHSSINDFLNCPRAYYLRAVYKDPVTKHKITEVKPSLTLGQIVHEVIDTISKEPQEERLKIPLEKRLNDHWSKVEGKKGGFKNKDEEMEFKTRATEMLNRLEKNPGPIIRKAIKLKSEGGLPYFWLSEEENIILCGKIDWIEYLEGNDSIHIIDFKTGKNEESEDSLQLPIYLLLAQNLQKRRIEKVSYWYLNKDEAPTEMAIPDYQESLDKIMEIAKRMKLAKQINYFKCPKDGCFFCNPLERIVKGEGELVGTSDYNQDIYFLSSEE
jgi:ATP-dependent helicase/DNAse subunit B